MAPKTVFAGLLMAAVLPAALGQTVSLRAEIPYNAHGCVRDCVQYIVDNGKDIGGALDCGGPYQEDCFCPTAADSLTVVSQHLNNCASSSCSRGDLTKDISSMRSYYASYCGDKGYKQDALDGWYNAASGPGEADATTTTEAEADTASKTTEAAQSEQNETQAPETTTEVAVSTQTRDVIGSELGDDASMSRVVVRLTSTLWVDNTAAPGSPDANNTDKKSGVNTTALGAGLGVGIPLVLALLGVGIWFLLRQRRRKAAAAAAAAVPSSTDQVQRPPPYVPHDTPASTKAEAMPKVAEVHQDKTELAGGQGVRRELAGQQIHPFPEQTVSPAVSVPGHHEMMVENRPHEMQAGNNQYYYSSQVPDRHELPGQHHY